MSVTFEYAVRDRSGSIVRGRMDGPNQAAVVTKLRSMGYAPVSISQTNTGLKKELSIPGFGKRVKLKELAIMARQLATMINSGLPLLRALSILEQQTDNAYLSEILGQARTDVEAGASLSGALGKFPRVFPPLMVSMIKAGEVGGFLDQVLLQVASNFEADVKLRGKIKSAMTYPVVVFVMAILAITGMLLFIVPTFASMFASLGGELPAPTRFLVWLSDLLKILMPFILVGLIVMGVLWRRYKNDERLRRVIDPMKLKAPVFGNLARKIALSRFTRNLGTMIHSGVPILQSLDIVADTSGNIVVARAVRDVQESVRRGESLAKPLEQHPIFPPMVVQMLAVGEDTGSLDTMLHKVSEFYDQEVEATTEALTSLIEPIMIAVVGGLVGAMIVAMYLPIFNVFDLIK